MNHLFAKISVLSVILVAFLAFPVTATGQTDTISLTQSPPFSESEEAVTVSVISRIINLNDKQTVWQVNGEVAESGVGITEITTTAGESGEVATVTFETIVDGEIVKRTLEINPVDVDLVWEASESYTPPFYKGKALHPGWGSVQITAIPHVYRTDGSKHNPDQLIYTWEYNGLVHGGESGRGERSFTVNALPQRGNTVTVNIETPGGTRVANESINLPISQPEVVLYEYSPLLGTQMESTIPDSFQLEGQEIEISAQPYFFLTESKTDENLQYEWNMNGEELTPPERKNVVRLRRQDNASGQARISVEVDDVSRIFSSQSANVTLEF